MDGLVRVQPIFYLYSRYGPRFIYHSSKVLKKVSNINSNNHGNHEGQNVSGPQVRRNGTSTERLYASQATSDAHAQPYSDLLRVSLSEKLLPGE